MNWKRLLISIVVIAVLLGGGYWVYQQFFAPASETAEDAPVVDVNTIAVDVGLDTVSAEGQIVPLDNTLLSFLLGGELAEILVEEGQSVAADDILMRLDSQDQEIALKQAETAVLQAESQVAAAETGRMAAEVGLEAANTDLRAAEAQLALLQAGPSDEQVALSQNLVAAAGAGIEQAAGNRDVVYEGAGSGEVGAAEAQLAAAQTELFSVRLNNESVANNVDLDDEVREQAQLRLNAAVANVNAAQTALDELVAGATDAERLAASGAVGAASGNRDASQAELDLLLAGTRDEQIAVAAASVEQAKDAVAEAELRVQQTETAIAQAQTGLTEAETAVTAAQSALNKTILTAPFAGTIASIPVKEGQIINSGIPVINMADFSRWQVKTTDLTELGIVSVARDLPVEVMVDAFPGEVLPGIVVDIAQISQDVRGDVTYAVTIDLDEDGDLPLRWGMTAFVTVDVK